MGFHCFLISCVSVYHKRCDYEVQQVCTKKLKTLFLIFWRAHRFWNIPRKSRFALFFLRVRSIVSTFLVFCVFYSILNSRLPKCGEFLELYSTDVATFIYKKWTCDKIDVHGGHWTSDYINISHCTHRWAATVMTTTLVKPILCSLALAFIWL